MPFSFQNKTVIISGGSQGLGFILAKNFLAHHANVVIAARNSEKIESAIKALTRFCKKNTIIGIPTDITCEKQCENLVSETIKKFHRIDILVNNAGVHGAKGLFEETDWVEWVSAIEINLKGTAQLCKAVIPSMKKQQSGKIITLSGGGATKPMPWMSAYAASKAGLVRFSECLAAELKPFHILVNTVAPGALNTALLDDVIQAGKALVGEAHYQQALVQKQSGGDDPQRAAQLCLMLASDENQTITGKLISAIWDPWEKFLSDPMLWNEPDCYTLRRITPSHLSGKKDD